MLNFRHRPLSFQCSVKCVQSSEVVIEPLECVADEWQAHLRRLVHRSTRSESLGLENGSIVRLVNLISREVRSIDCRCQPRLERCTNAAEAVEFDATEEWVVLDLMGTASS